MWCFMGVLPSDGAFPRFATEGPGDRRAGRQAPEAEPESVAAPRTLKPADRGVFSRDLHRVTRALAQLLALAPGAEAPASGTRLTQGPVRLGADDESPPGGLVEPPCEVGFELAQ